MSRVVAQPTPTVDLLESELRWLEDNLYQMDDQLELTLQQLESAKRNNAVLRFELAEAKKLAANCRGNNAVGKRSSSSGAVVTDTDDSDAGFDEEKDDGDDPFQFTPPDVQLGPASGSGDENEPDGNSNDPEPEELERSRPLDLMGEEPSGDSINGSTDPNPEARDVEPRTVPELPAPSDTREPFPRVQPTAPFFDPRAEPENSVEVQDDLRTVSRIRLNQRLTGGYNFDGVTGHEGIMVVVEPQDAESRYVPAAGPLTVEVRDPRQKGLDARVGKWKFDATEAGQKLRRTLMGRGFHLELPWPATPPQSERLEVLVAYETPDGRTLRTSREIIVKPMTAALEARAAKAEREWTPWRQRPPLRAASSENAPTLQWTGER